MGSNVRWDRIESITPLWWCKAVASPTVDRLPVIVVSATYAFPDHQERAERSGADAYFEQPVLAEQLGAEVRRLPAERKAGGPQR